jgi:hypothetical protein
MRTGVHPLEGAWGTAIAQMPLALLAPRDRAVRVTQPVESMVRPCEVEPDSPDVRPVGVAIPGIALMDLSA